MAEVKKQKKMPRKKATKSCLLYTSDAADD